MYVCSVSFIFLDPNSLALFGELKIYAALMCADFSRLPLLLALYCVHKTNFVN